jgi:alkanesulfonate monooxygenase SsuD/methylene tetrahydromethanopterin reductase-like flavin-dependent oxidoreductase (luciferase family)
VNFPFSRQPEEGATAQSTLLAKQLATIDYLSGGRLTLGFGMGYIPGQAAAFGVDFSTRAARGREHLEAAQAILSSPGSASYHGRFVDFDAIESFPRARQSPLEVVAGEHSDLAYRQALTMPTVGMDSV